MSLVEILIRVLMVAAVACSTVSLASSAIRARHAWRRLNAEKRELDAFGDIARP